jgi:hypothetical protein
LCATTMSPCRGAAYWLNNREAVGRNRPRPRLARKDMLRVAFADGVPLDFGH